MTILIDINHPAHVHYFRNLVKSLSDEGHRFIVSNRDDNLINYLLDHYGIEHIPRNKRPDKSTRWGSLKYLLRAIWLNYRSLKNDNFDLVLGFGSTIGAVLSLLFGKPCILLDDTEHNNLNHFLYRSFTNALITPYYFSKEVKSDQIRIRAFIEQLYLSIPEGREHRSDNKGYVLFRFISYSAAHDRGINISELKELRRGMVNYFSAHSTVYVSAEDQDTADEYSEYQLSFKPEHVHRVIQNATLFISEGATMASEAAILGVPYIYTNPLRVGYIEEQVRLSEGCERMSYRELANWLKEEPSLFSLLTKRNVDINDDKLLDPTEFLKWFVLNYPGSLEFCRGRSIDRAAFSNFPKNLKSQ